MNSYIEDFQKDDREKESDLIISICGPSGAGKGTLGRFIADKLGVSFYSAGDFFRQLADDKGLTVEELSEQADKETDLEVDRRTLEKALNEDCVVESRISAWVLGDYADLTIYVTADLEERARRVMSDLENRENEEGGESLEEVKERIRKRDEDNDRRYEEYYGIDMGNREIFDMVIDNTEMGIEEQQRLVEKALKDEFPERFEE
ncbi:MAG: (d)CMP kinase [Candidatus Nanohalobium sp.]